MMEVKQNISVDFNDLITSNSNGDSNNSNSNSDDVTAKVISLETSKQKTDLLKTNEIATNGAVSSVNKNDNEDNETLVETTAAIDVDVDAAELDLNEPVNAELEEALLAEDDTVDKILADVVVPIRDPGDDLDTLLSKINDLVEDCIETDVTKPTTDAKPIHEAETESNGKEAKDSSNKENEEEEIEVKKVQAEKKIADDEHEESAAVDDKTADKDVEMKSIAEHSAEEENKATNAKEHDTPEETIIDEKEPACKKSKDDEDENESNIEMKTDKVKDLVILSVTLDDDDDEDEDDKEVKKSSTETKPEEPNSKNTTTNEEKVETESDEKSKPEETKVSEAPASLEIEDSDDDIIFFVDNPVPARDKKEVNEAKSKDPSAEAKKTSCVVEDDDDDVVLLDDDDDDEDDAKESNKKTDEEKEEICKETENLENKKTNEKLSEVEKIEVPKETKKDEDTTEVSDKTESPQTEENKTELKFDNTDNARDDFAVAEKEPLEKKETPKPKSEEGDDTNSNCSSSSNLLQEAKATSGAEEEHAEEEHAEEIENDEDDEAEAEADGEVEVDAEAEAEAEDIDGDTELLEGLETIESREALKDVESEDKEIALPAKRIRLSVDAKDEEKKEISLDESDDKSDSITIVESDDNVTKEITTETDESTAERKGLEASTSVAVKRSHDSMVEQSEEDGIAKVKEKDEEEIVSKKIKTDEENSSPSVVEEEKSEGELAECTALFDDDVDDKTDLKTIAHLETLSVKMEQKEEPPSEAQAELKVVASNIPIPLYPPPKFDTFVSSIQLDFFKRFRKSLDKMTKNDLEELAMEKIIEAIVHKGEFAEMRDMIDKQENIIAAYRTKMSELSKHFRDLEMVHSRVLKDIEAKNSQFIMPVKITRAVGLQVFIPSRKTSDANINAPTVVVGNSPQRVAVNAATPSHISPQRPQSTVEARTSTGNSALASAAAAAAMNTRRGCVQKITPQRPDPSGASNSPTVMTQIASSYRSASAQTSLASSSPMVTPNPPRILNKNSISASMLKNRYSAPTAHEQQQHRQQLLQQQQQRQQQIQNNVRKLAPKPTTVGNAAPQYRRSESLPQQPQQQSASASNSVMDNYMSSLNQLPPGVPAVSITPAKPKEKAVIDLTDEDDALSAAAAAASARPRLPTPGPSNNAAQYANNRNVPPLTRMPGVNQMAANNKPQVAPRPLSTMQAQKPGNNSMVSSISTPPGTSITRVHISANNAATQRAKYGHPAPLPATPPQTFNPAWKLPPPRPTIRISNLDNGIVISWTMDDAENRHAECVSYQIYAYQETSSAPAVDSWRHVGDVKAMLLPMAVTLTQFQEGQRYYFAVRAVDVHQRFGHFSLPKTWS